MIYADYDALPGVRASRLRLMAASPLHYHEAQDRDTPALGALRAMHTLLLEPDRWDADYVVYDGVRRGRLYDAVCETAEGRTILNPREAAQARAVADGVLRHAEARRLLTAPGTSEVTLSWTDPATGLPCKARLDRLLQSGIVLDCKGYGTSDPRVIGRRVVTLGAHLQAAHYLDGLRIARGIEARYLLICYETAPPYDVAVVELEPDGALALGRSERTRLMGRLAECEATGHWPGRCPELVPLELPAWTAAGDLDLTDIPEEE